MPAFLNRAVLTAIWVTFSAIAAAQPLGVRELVGAEPQLVISRGATMQALESQPIRAANLSQLASLRTLPLAPGTILVRFGGVRVGNGQSQRVLVLREDGIWGYARTDQNIFEFEPRIAVLMQEASQGRPSVMLVRDTSRKATVAGVDVTIDFSRGEIYAYDQPANVNDPAVFRAALGAEKLPRSLSHCAAAGPARHPIRSSSSSNPRTWCG
jgi:hypothetical protein